MAALSSIRRNPDGPLLGLCHNTPVGTKSPDPLCPPYLQILATLLLNRSVKFPRVPITGLKYQFFISYALGKYQTTPVIMPVCVFTVHCVKVFSQLLAGFWKNAWLVGKSPPLLESELRLPTAGPLLLSSIKSCKNCGCMVKVMLSITKMLSTCRLH